MESVFRKDLFADRVVFVTGGGSGICKGIAEAFAAHGAKTVITSRKLERLEETAREIEATYGQPCHPVAADVRDPLAIRAAVDSALQRFGRIDILINGAAGNFLAPAAQLSPNGFKTVMDIDVNGTFNTCKAVFDAFFAENGGQIINISATLQYTGTLLQVHAASAKSAVDTMTRILATEWGPLKIRVNAIAPGPIGDTEGMRRLAPEGYQAKMEAKIPLGRFGTIAEVADSALFLASPAARYITGSILVVDGGEWLAGRNLDLFPS